jgi:hypothetical protein
LKQPSLQITKAAVAVSDTGRPWHSASYQHMLIENLDALMIEENQKKTDFP